MKKGERAAVGHKWRKQRQSFGVLVKKSEQWVKCHIRININKGQIKGSNVCG